MTQVLPTDSSPGFSLDHKFLARNDRIYLTGIQALLRVLIDQRRADVRRGLNTAGFVSGYPGSPLGGVDLELQRQRRVLEDNNILHVPGLNEDLAATAVFGSQVVDRLPGVRVDGVFGMWFGKAPGVDRSGDAFRHFNYRGVHRNGGVLAVAGDDPNATSTILPSDSNSAFYDWYMPVLTPGDVQDVIDLGLHGYALSRASGLAVGFKIVTDVADASGTALVDPDRIQPAIPSVELDGKPFHPVPRLNEAGKLMIEAERDLVYGRLAVARAYGRENHLNAVVVNPADAWLGIIAPGKTYYDLRQALRQLGLDDEGLRHAGIRVCKVGMPFPMDPRTIREFGAGLEEVIVVEDKRQFLELFIKDAMYAMAERPRVIGKYDDDDKNLLPAYGELTADIIARAIAPRISRKVQLEATLMERLALGRGNRESIKLSVERTAYFCSGCPHNRSLVVPDGSVVGAGIGCHIMAIGVAREEFGELAGYTHMGAEGAQWIGMAPFTDTSHIFQNLGDGTFFHSGSLAVRFAVAARINITYKLLYNSAVGMTGGQEVQGAIAVPALTRLLEAEGVTRIIVTTDDPKKYRRVTLAANAEVRHRDELIDAQKALAGTSGVTVLIHDQQCAAEKRRDRKRGKLIEPSQHIFVNKRVCEGCGDCGTKSNCLSVQTVETEFGAKTEIHQSSCNYDYSCLDGDCPSFLTIDTSPSRKRKTARRRPSRASTPKRPSPDSPPRPDYIVPPEAFSIYMSGIGGTGVVTVSQILATAAVLAGKQVRNLDLTGSSQKAGPVVSQLQVFTQAKDVASSISEGQVDLYLAFDLLTAMKQDNLAKVNQLRTVAVASSSRVPTGRMTTDKSATYPDLDEMRSTLDGLTRRASNRYVDALHIAESLFGTHMAANMLLVGVAYQAGALPIDASAIEEAIRLNKTAVEDNISAFRWGCVAVADPERLFAVAPPADTDAESGLSSTATRIVDNVGGDAELSHLLRVRVPDLIGYQDEQYARSYADFVKQMVAAEDRCTPGRTEVGHTVAIRLHQLMAYKDEYEVARLHLQERSSAEIAEVFGKDVKVYWNLHPPILRAMGMNRKIKLGAWFTPAFKALHGMKRVRGSRADLFGYAKVRRIERALVAHYRSLVEDAVSSLTTANHDDIVELADLVGLVRGYESVKLGNLRVYIERVQELTNEIGVDAHAEVLEGLLEKSVMRVTLGPTAPDR